MAQKLDDDDYVANLLKQDAKTATKAYELVGMDAFNPRRVNSRAPKPNTSFLRHIIRQTDSHNAALLAKEAEESNTRLRRMEYERARAQRKEKAQQQSKSDRRSTPLHSNDDSRPIALRQEADWRGHGNERHSRHSRRDCEAPGESKGRRRWESNDGNDEVRHNKTKHQDRDDKHVTKKRKRSSSPGSKKHGSRRREEEEEVDHHRWRRREQSSRHRNRRSQFTSPSRSRSRSRTRSDRHDRKHRTRHPSHSHSIERAPANPSRTRNPAETRQKISNTSRHSASPAIDSDPLEAIVGPLPPPVQPAVRSRGRGAHKAKAMGIDSRFSPAYNPSVDVQLGSEAEDEWGDALEAIKDRQRWQQQGADRLKAAGFSEEQVRKWERGEEQTEEDVVWTRQGQAREWDRGKVIDEEGDVALKVDFGRLQ